MLVLTMNTRKEVSNIKTYEIRVDSKDWKEPAHFDIEANRLSEALEKLGGLINEESDNNKELFIRVRNEISEASEYAHSIYYPEDEIA